MFQPLLLITKDCFLIQKQYTTIADWSFPFPPGEYLPMNWHKIAAQVRPKRGGGGFQLLACLQSLFCFTVIKLPLMITKAGRGRPERIFVVKKSLVLPSVCTHRVSTKHMQAPAAGKQYRLIFFLEGKEGNGKWRIGRGYENEMVMRRRKFRRLFL